MKNSIEYKLTQDEILDPIFNFHKEDYLEHDKCDSPMIESHQSYCPYLFLCLIVTFIEAAPLKDRKE